MNNPYVEFDKSLNGPIPYVDPSRAADLPDAFFDKYSETNVQQIFQRNIEREYIPKQAALISVTGQCMITKQLGNIQTIVKNTPAGGVSVEYPVSPRSGDTSEIQSLPEKQTYMKTLDKATIKYVIPPEVSILGDTNTIHADYMLEAYEDLAAKIDRETFKTLESRVTAANTDGATAPWGGTGATPEQDVATAIGNIIENSSIDPNRINTPGMWALILPIQVYDKLNAIGVIDNIKTTIGEYIVKRWGVDIFYSRKPFLATDWPLTDKAFLIPKNDRYVGAFGYFDGGGRVPSMFVDQSEAGIKVSANIWMNYLPTPDEVDGSLTTNKRIAKITGIV